ncbi:hypothetical protein FRC04_007151 [Tulasnella sp. 424]|nr:hypothetical protein FRC04_007151 [Tulasnella sp. 424]KAG8974589.1 hypothetical protein FRC05_007065 [Tulasnella sp. 425]
MDPSYVTNLHALLAQTVASDTNLIKNATATLNQQYYKDPACIPALFEIIATSPDQNIRQLAAVELRKRISQGDGKLWRALDVNIRQQVKTKILETILAEQVAIVRHSTARVIAAIASWDLASNAWPELMPFLQRATSSPTAAHREVGIYVMYSVLETVIEGIKQQTSSLFTIFTELIKDPESAQVRITTVQALGVLAQYIEPEDKQDIKTFQALVPQILGVVNETCAANNEPAARDGFDVVETLLILETPLLSKSIPALVEFCLATGANKEIDDEIRHMALNALNWTIKYKKSKIQSLNMAKAILEILLPIGSEADPEDNDEDSPSRLAFRAVDALATVLPPQQVFPPLHQLVTQYMQSPDPGLRKAAMMAFGVTVEGCSEYIRPHMKNLWPLIDSGLTDREAVVRKAACIAFACICEWLEEECAERHSVLLPAILQLTDDEGTQQAACTALDAYLEILDVEIHQYLPTIMNQLTKLLGTAPIPVKAVVTGAIGSAAHASKAAFTPYFEETINRLQPFLTLEKEGEEQDLRGIATDAIGTLAEAVGRDKFAPYVPDLMKASFDGARKGSARLRECSYIFFGVMAKVFGQDFAPYLEHVMPMLLESLKQTEGGGDDTIDQIVKNHPEAFSTGDSSQEIIDITPQAEDPATSITVNSAIAIEKEIAADTMGTIFSYTGNYFLPWLEQCTVALIEQLNHYYEGIRKSALTSLFQFLRSFYDLSNSPLWEPGANLTIPLDPKIGHLIDLVMKPVMELWVMEDDKSVVSTLCQELSETLAKIGPGMLSKYFNEICHNIQAILEGKSLCQQDPDADEDDEPLEEQAEFDSVLISATGDLVSSLATVLGQDFAQVFGTFLPLIAKYTSAQRSNTDRASAIGTLGEVITSMKGGITTFTQPVLEVTTGLLKDEDPEVRSNAAFATGVLVENSDTDLSAHYGTILQRLSHLFNLQPDAGQSEKHGRDNAAGAVSRMIIKNSAAVPLDQVLPVVYGALPLKNDFLENAPVYRSIFHLFRTNPPIVMNYLQILLPAFAAVLSPETTDQLTPDVRAELVELIRHLQQQVPDQVAAAGLAAVA